MKLSLFKDYRERGEGRGERGEGRGERGEGRGERGGQNRIPRRPASSRRDGRGDKGGGIAIGNNVGSNIDNKQTPTISQIREGREFYRNF